MTIEHIELALYFHGEPVDCVFDLDRCVGIKMPEPAAKIGRAAHLPEQPAQRFGALRTVLGQERAEFLRQIQQDRARFKHPLRLGFAMVHQRRDLRIRIGRHKAAAELIAIADLDQPGIVFSTLVPQR